MKTITLNQEVLIGNILEYILETESENFYEQLQEGNVADEHIYWHSIKYYADNIVNSPEPYDDILIFSPEEYKLLKKKENKYLFEDFPKYSWTHDKISDQWFMNIKHPLSIKPLSGK